MPRKTAPASPRRHTKSRTVRTGVSEPARTSNRPPTIPARTSNRPPAKLPEPGAPATTIPADSTPDALEDLYARGLTDGLPVVLPTRERVQRAIDAAGRSAAELIALVPPN